MRFQSMFILESLYEKHITFYKCNSNFHTRARDDLQTLYYWPKKWQNIYNFCALKCYNKIPEQVKYLQLNKHELCIKSLLTKSAFYTFEKYLNYDVSVLCFVCF